MTGMYNVLETLREIESAQRTGSVSVRSSAEPASGGRESIVNRRDSQADVDSRQTDVCRSLTAKERKIHDDGLVSVLKQIHDDLDAAVFEAYGWPVTLTDEEILERLVALNHERAAEEAAGKIRWLRPEFQNPQTGEPSKTQQTLPAAEPDEEEDDSETETKGKKKAPKAAGKATDKAVWPATLPERIRAVRGALTAIGKPATVEDIASRFTRANKANVTELLDTLVAVGQARRRAGKYAG